MPSIKTLVKVAAIGGVITTGTGYILRYMFQQRIRTTATYKEALKLVHGHEKTVQYLGEPIKEGKIEFGPSVDNSRSFSVALKGTNTKGKLDCEVLLKEPDKQPEIQKVEIKFANIPNQIFVIRDLNIQ